MRMTAKKCAKAPQLEIVLKEKQSNNADLAFLQSAHPFHLYYVWLKERNQTDDIETDLPQNMTTPSSKRQRDVIRMTAKKSAAAPQMEVLLKVRQSENPDFAFLQPVHPCHPYYLWLKEKDQAPKRAVPDTSSESKPEAEGKKPGVQGLLALYSSSSSEDEGDDEKVREDDNDDPEVTKPDDNVQSSSKEEEERKAKRLKRAKLMSGHYKLSLLKS